MNDVRLVKELILKLKAGKLIDPNSCLPNSFIGYYLNLTDRKHATNQYKNQIK